LGVPGQLLRVGIPGDSPRALVEHWESTHDFETLQTILNNVDNFVCYMWNRFMARNLCHLERRVWR
jgi:hypothetical protein